MGDNKRKKKADGKRVALEQTHEVVYLQRLYGISLLELHLAIRLMRGNFEDLGGTERQQLRKLLAEYNVKPTSLRRANRAARKAGK